MAKIGVFDSENDKLAGQILDDGSVVAAARLGEFLTEMSENGVPVWSGEIDGDTAIETVELVPLEKVDPDVLRDTLERAGFTLVQIP